MRSPARWRGLRRPSCPPRRPAAASRRRDERAHLRAHPGPCAPQAVPGSPQSPFRRIQPSRGSASACPLGHLFYSFPPPSVSGCCSLTEAGGGAPRRHPPEVSDELDLDDLGGVAATLADPHDSGVSGRAVGVL